MPDSLYANTRPDSTPEAWEPLGEHLAAVAASAATFARPFGADGLAAAAGLLHDVRKASPRFQAYLRGEAASTDHSTAGAQLACRLFGNRLGKLLAYVVARHNAGLAMRHAYM